jgi:PBP1b-binding outer membrane lipoprotein LpoB
MKKISSALLCALLMFSLTACGKNNDSKSEVQKNPPVAATVEQPPVQITVAQPTPVQPPVVQAPIAQPAPAMVQKQPPVRIEQLPMNITIRQPDSGGYVYMDATYTNKSDSNIVSFRAIVLLKDKNEKAYLSNHDTVLPGETSPKFDTFGPKSLNTSDIEILKYDITVANKDGSKTSFEYDNKLKQYDVR